MKFIKSRIESSKIFESAEWKILKTIPK